MLATIISALGTFARGFTTWLTDHLVVEAIIYTPVVREGVSTYSRDMTRGGFIGREPEMWFQDYEHYLNNDRVYIGSQGHVQFVRQNGNPVTVDEGHFRLLLDYCNHYDTQDLPDHIITARTLLCYPTK